VLVDEIIAAIEAARDKVIADEIKAMVKMGLPRNMARQSVAARFHLKVEDEESPNGTSDFEGHWRDLG
jgi:hypothetical protein